MSNVHQAFRRADPAPLGGRTGRPAMWQYNDCTSYGVDYLSSRYVNCLTPSPRA